MGMEQTHGLRRGIVAHAAWVLTRRQGRQSIVVLLLGAFIGLATLTMTVEGIVNVAQIAAAGEPILQMHMGMFRCSNSTGTGA